MQPEMLKAEAGSLCLGSWPQGSWALGVGLAREPQNQSRAWQPHSSSCEICWELPGLWCGGFQSQDQLFPPANEKVLVTAAHEGEGCAPYRKKQPWRQPPEPRAATDTHQNKWQSFPGFGGNSIAREAKGQVGRANNPRMEQSQQLPALPKTAGLALQRFLWLLYLHQADLKSCSHCTDGTERKYLGYSSIAILRIFIIVLSLLRPFGLT